MARLNTRAGAAVLAFGVVLALESRATALSWTGPMLTVAGSCHSRPLPGCNGAGGDNGPATSAGMWSPGDTAVDGIGNLYITDSLNNRIRRVSTAGTITTIAGDGTPASTGDGGPASAAQVDIPLGLAFDGSGNLFIAESRGHRIRKIAAGTNIITTVAGTGTPGYNGDNLPATSAQLQNPRSVAVDAAGNLFISDTYNFRVREVTAADGIITTIAGTGGNGFGGDGGPAVSALLSHVQGVEVDAGGNVYVADFDNRRVREIIAATGVIVTVAGNGGGGNAGDGGLATDAQLTGPEGVAVDATYLYIADSSGDRVRRVHLSNHLIRTVAGSGVLPCTLTCDGRYPSTAVMLHTPRSVTVDTAGNLFITAEDGLVQEVVAAPLVMPRDVPLLGDIDADGKADLVVWSVDTGTWRWLTSSSGYSDASAGTKQWGNQSLGDVPLLGDIDGDGKADLVVWRASTGTWFWLTSSSGYDYAAHGQKQWGNQSLGDVPFLGDIDGDGKADLVVWRESTGVWYWLTSSTAYSYAGGAAQSWGDQRRADVALLGDFDRDGRSDLTVYSISDAVDGAAFNWRGSSTGLAGNVGWGNRRLDIPMLGDMDGDGKADPIVWRKAEGTWYWLSSSNGYNNSGGLSRQWGSQSLGDVPVIGDLDGDGKTDLTVWRASTRTWYWLTSSTGYDYASGHARSF